MIGVFPLKERPEIAILLLFDAVVFGLSIGLYNGIGLVKAADEAITGLASHPWISRRIRTGKSEFVQRQLRLLLNCISNSIHF